MTASETARDSIGARAAGVLLATAVGAAIYLTEEPRVAAARARLADVEATLRSDEVMLRERSRLHALRNALALRYASIVAQDPEALFLRELASTARRHGVTVVATTIAHDPSVSSVPARHGDLLISHRGSIELRGSYRALLTAIADLSTGAGIVAVDIPSLRRDGNAVTATIPIALYEPARIDGTPR